MNGYEQIKYGEAAYFGEALIAAQWAGDAAFAQYAAAQGVDVWEALLPYAGARARARVGVVGVRVEVVVFIWGAGLYARSMM